MLFFTLLISKRRKFRSFVKIDQEGICTTVMRCRESPGDSWVEVDDFCLSWLGKPFSSRDSLMPAVNVRPTHFR